MKRKPIESQGLDLIVRIAFDEEFSLVTGQGLRLERKEALELLLKKELIRRNYESPLGGDRKDYSLTDEGRRVYDQFRRYAQEVLRTPAFS